MNARVMVPLSAQCYAASERSQASAGPSVEPRASWRERSPRWRLACPFRCFPRARIAAPQGLMIGAIVVGTLYVARTRLAGDLPSYQRVLSEKIGSLRRSAASSTALETAAGALKKLQTELSQPAAPPANTPTPTLDNKDSGRPVLVEIRTPEPRPLEILQSVAGTLLPPLATAGIVILFVIFILLQRED